MGVGLFLPPILSMKAKEALDKLFTMSFKTVLDVGSGDGVHSKEFKHRLKDVLSISLIPPADIIGDFLKHDGKYDCIWASHVLEHQRNVGLFLEHCYECLNDNGILAITVPPAKDEIVGGHLTVWNEGLLLYNLILAGFDCSNASVKRYGYNISVIVRKKKANIEGLIYDYGDIEKIAQYFPVKVKHGFNGNMGEINW